ncbi:MAG: FliA/WhiG family RNA polymerase sigma factor [Phycisphaerales bacterium]
MPATASKGKISSASTTSTRRRFADRIIISPQYAKYEEMQIEEVWEEYRKTQAQDIRNYFMEKYLPLVRYNAERIYTRLPDEVDVEDLMSAGVFGLMDAIDLFDPDRKVKFATYCASRIRGAILDELRSMDWVPRLVRHRSAKVEGARSSLEKELGRAPTEEEIATRLGADPEELKKIMKDGSARSIKSLSRRCYDTDSNREVTEIDIIQDDSQTNPLTEIQRKDLKNLLTKGLTRAERLIVVLYYYEEMTMKEIGATLDLSESRVSQMHSSILLRLKAQMQHRSREFEPSN